MMKLNLSAIIKQKRKLEFILIAFCLLLLLIVGFYISKHSKTTKANSCVGDTCTLDTGDLIPANFEGMNVIINNRNIGEIYADKVKVWQDDNGHQKGTECATLNNNLIDHWSMDETSGDVIKNSGSNHSFATTPATIVPSVDAVHRNARNYSPDSHGDAAVEDDRLSTFTVGMWVNPDTVSPAGNERFLFMIGHAYDAQGGFRLTMPSNTSRLKLSLKTTNFGNQSITTTTSLSLGTWQYVYFTYSPTAGASIYINGTLQASGLVNGGNLVYDIANHEMDGWAQIGYRWGSGFESFDGKIDDVRIYNKILTTQEAQVIRTMTDDSMNPACDSKRHFKSLSIVDGNITHQRLFPGDMVEDTDGDGSLADETVRTARWKKVDLEVENNFIATGGSISASYKGYPGGYSGYGSSSGIDNFNNRFIYAYGPGAGGACPSGGDGGGGGYGGVGGRGGRTACVAGVSYPTPFTDQTVSFEFGSGGGGGYDAGGANTSRGTGGDGGGRIHIKASRIEIQNSWIHAKGDDSNMSENQIDDNQAAGGGGSGGTVWLESPIIFFPTNSEPADFTPGKGYTGVPSNIAEPGTITIRTQIINSPSSNLVVSGGWSAKEGTVSTYPIRCAGDSQCGGGGGGGRIFLTGGNRQANAMKVLTPISRRGVATSFNPYNLEKDDIIKVEIFIGSGVNATYNLEDQWLVSSDGLSQCRPISTEGFNVAPTNFSVNPLTWLNLDRDTYTSVYYRCKVN